MKFFPVLLLAILTVVCLPAQAGHDDAPAPASTGALPQLSAAQQQAAGVVVEHPVAAKAPSRIAAYGRVLDTAALTADNGKLDAARAADRAADDELARLRKLYRGGAGASLKSLQAAQAAQVGTQAAAQAAAAAFALHWGPLTALSDSGRRALIDALSRHRGVLLRADVPGRNSIAKIPRAARVDVDGVDYPARVLGVLPRAGPTLESVGLLLQLNHPPLGLGTGAHLPVILEGDPLSGVVVPDGALLYGPQGVYVYRRLPGKTGNGLTRFAPVPVKLLRATGGGWLVSGIDADDDIVIRGAAALWSLQGLGSMSGGDDD